MLARTPAPPYYAVIFTSLRNPEDNGYDKMAARMAELCAQQPGFLGMDHARSEVGITVCYWDSEESILAWKKNSEHAVAQSLGKQWYAAHRVRIAKVEREYGSPK